MINHELFAVSFARAVHVMREQPPVVERQKSALRAIFALTSIAPASLHVRGGGLAVDDVDIPMGAPHMRELCDLLAGHGVLDLEIARGAGPADLLKLVRALAVQPGGYEHGDGVAHRVRDSQAIRVAITVASEDDAPNIEPAAHRPASISRAFEMMKDEFADWKPELRENEEDVNLPREIDLGIEPLHPTYRDSLRAMPAIVEQGPDPAEQDLPVPAHSPLGRALVALRRNPYGGNALDLLSDLGRVVAESLQEDAVVPAMRAAAAAIMLEPGAPEGSPRNSYAIALKRMLTKEAMAQVAPFLLVPEEAPVATFVLHRAGAVAADVLLGLLASSESMKERKSYMAALRGIPSGTEHIVAMLGHKQWFIARNVAELAGEMRLEEAVSQLARLLDHPDARVQKAAVVALAKVGSNATVTPLLGVLKGKSQELRGLVAASLGRRAAPALAMPIAALAADEQDPDILREYYRALGRIGTREAVQVLVKAAEPGGRLLGRRPAAIRLAALEGLKVAPPEATIAPLESLTRDADKAVATAARGALELVRSGSELGAPASEL